MILYLAILGLILLTVLVGAVVVLVGLGVKNAIKDNKDGPNAS